MQRRSITALETHVVCVASHFLTFDIFGVPYSEPAFASISAFQHSDSESLDPCERPSSPRPPPVHGVAYLLTANDYRRLVLSEGSGIGYREVSLVASVVSSKDTASGRRDSEMVVRTLQAKYPFRPNAAPSFRYLVGTTPRCDPLGVRANNWPNRAC